MFFLRKLLTTLLVVFIASCLCKTDDENRLFRANKLNLIWRKLQGKMSANKLEDLKLSLTDLDNKEMNWKELKLHGGDADGEIEASLRRTLFRILDKYGYGNLAGDVSEPKPAPGVEDNTVRNNEDFSDTRLQNLWKLAKQHGKFDDEEMGELRKEFEHHKQKIEEYQLLLNTLQKQHDVSENSVEFHDKLKEHELEKLKIELKDKYISMKKNYIQLKDKVTGEVVKSPFKDYRVIELWERARKNNFSEEELESIKEELTHFEHKIGKHEHFRDQVKKTEKKVEAGKSVDHSTYQHHIKKAKEHMKYVKKMHQTLLDKVSRRDEL